MLIHQIEAEVLDEALSSCQLSAVRDDRQDDPVSRGVSVSERRACSVVRRTRTYANCVWRDPEGMATRSLSRSSLVAPGEHVTCLESNRLRASPNE